jgi:imidazolonepropionase
MQELAIIPDGAVLIRDGMIEDVGPTRRVANLLRARRARELDATGRVVLPAFVDPDAPLVTKALSTGQKARLEKSASKDDGPPIAESLRVMSRRRMEMRSTGMAHTLAS